MPQIKKKYHLDEYQKYLPVTFLFLDYSFKKKKKTYISKNRFNKKNIYNSEVSECFVSDKPISKLL